jgi:hypothetical protein
MGREAKQPAERTPHVVSSSRVCEGSGYHACVVGCVGDLGVLAMRFDCSPTQRAVVAVRSSQLRRPQHFYLFRGMCSAWVPGSVLGSLAWENRTFSSGSLTSDHMAQANRRGCLTATDRLQVRGSVCPEGPALPWQWPQLMAAWPLDPRVWRPRGCLDPIPERIGSSTVSGWRVIETPVCLGFRSCDRDSHLL